MKENNDEKEEIDKNNEIKEKKEKEESFNSKLNFYDEKVDIKLNSDYNSFIANICNILQIPKDKLKSLSMSYYDEDGDSIILSTEEDYILFLQQLKDKLVDTINVEIKENEEIDPIECFGSALDYQEQINKANNQIKDDNNIIYNDIGDGFKKSSNNIVDDNIINNNIMNNIILNEEKNNDDFPVDDIIFLYKCTFCSTYPIICTLYYCPECVLYACEDCMKNIRNHIHPVQKFESNIELMKVKEKENNDIEKKNQINNNQNHINDIRQNNLNDNHNDINDEQNIIENNDDSERQNPWKCNLFRGDSSEYAFFHLFSNLNPIKVLKEKKMQYLLKKHRGIIKNISKVRKARKKYDLQGVDDFKLLEALRKADGDIDKAITLIYQ